MAYPHAKRAVGVRAANAELRSQRMDREDLEQEALIHLWLALRKFDDSRSSLRTFVEVVVSNKITSLLRRVLAGKRTRPTNCHFLSDSPRLIVAIELRLDLDRALTELGRGDRKVANLLQECGPAEVARALGISRAAAYRAIERIRTAFAEAGLAG